MSVLGSLLIVGITSFAINFFYHCATSKAPERKVCPENSLSDNMWHIYSMFTEQSMQLIFIRFNIQLRLQFLQIILVSMVFLS